MTMRALTAGGLAIVMALAPLPMALAQGGTAMFGGFLEQSSDPISIDADLLEWSQRDGRDVIEYSGNVVATRGNMTIRAARLTVFLPVAGASNGTTFDRIEAAGNVSISAGPQNATAESAVMDMVAQTVVMSGNVALNDGVNQMAGQRLTVDLANGNWQIDAGNDRVRTILNPDL
jgi:lipopolysaccharide export system protein LptA